MKIRDKILIIQLLLFITLSIVLVETVNAGQNDVWKTAARNYYSENYNKVTEILQEYRGKEIITEEDFKAIEYLVKAEIKLLNLNEAEVLIGKLEESGYKKAELYWLLGREYLNREGHFDNAMFEKARDKLKISRELGLFGIEQKRDLGQALVGMNEFSQAIELLESVREKDPGTTDLNALARAYHKTEELRKARDIYERLIVLNPDDAGAYLTLGNIYRELDNHQEAADVYNQGLNFKPQNIALKKALAETEFFLERYKEAEELMLNILESHPHMYEIHYYLGKIYEEKGELDQAQNKYEEAIKYNSEYVRGYLALGNLYLSRNNHYRAISQFTNAIEINPDYAKSYYFIGKTFYQLEMYEKALTEVNNAFRRNPGLDKARELREVLLEKLKEQNS